MIKLLAATCLKLKTDKMVIINPLPDILFVFTKGSSQFSYNQTIQLVPDMVTYVVNLSIYNLILILYGSSLKELYPQVDKEILKKYKMKGTSNFTIIPICEYKSTKYLPIIKYEKSNIVKEIKSSYIGLTDTSVIFDEKSGKTDGYKLLIPMDENTVYYDEEIINHLAKPHVQSLHYATLYRVLESFSLFSIIYIFILFFFF